MDKRIDKNLYNKFIKNLEIEDIQLNELTTRCFVDLDDIESELYMELSYKCIDMKIKSIDEMNVFPEFDVKVKSNEMVCLKIRLKFKIKYTIDSLNSFNDQYLELFIDKNVPINIWPYAREVISSITTRMGYPQLIIKPFKGKVC